MSAHSPLPWRKRTGLEGERLIVSGERGLDVVCQYGHDHTADEIDYVEADGSLIEAAPNLLAAATHAMSWLEAMRDPASDPGMVARGELTVWAALRDAVAKAEGR